VSAVAGSGQRAGSTLHILNGDCTRVLLERTGLQGTFSVWADPLYDGPVAGEDVPRAAWRTVRARWIASQGYGTEPEVLATLERWDRGLGSYADHDEVVIWCEHDLFDQLLLIHHLHWFHRADSNASHLRLICVGEYPGKPGFKGLGELSPPELSGLYPVREPITAAQLELGARAWRAFVAPDPTGLQQVFAGDTRSLPFLAPALQRLLAEYPSVENGLSRSEQRILELLDSQGALDLRALVDAFQQGEQVFFPGDGLIPHVRRLAGGSSPAVKLYGGAAVPGAFEGVTAVITDVGRDLLARRRDWLKLHGIDRWVGGVHLQGGEVAWRWDARTLRLATRP
jgi:hypothetical protein